MPAIFTPIGATVTVSATTASAATALTATNSLGGGSVRLASLSANAVVFVAFGDSSVTATTASMPILPGTVEVFEVGPKSTYMATITGSGTATLYATTGQGN